MSEFHLMRTWYRTDADPGEPDYAGAFSDTIPGRAMEGGTSVVNVDWSRKGWVEVTFLAPGRGHVADGPGYPIGPMKPGVTPP